MKTLNTRICLYQVVAIVLAIVIIFSCIPFTASAAEGPIEIRTIEDLYSIRNNLSGNYILMNDIDLTEATAQGGDWDSGKGWTPIGNEDSPFIGSFDGNRFSIIGLQSGTGGLFYSIKNATIKNLDIIQANVVGGTIAVFVENSQLFGVQVESCEIGYIQKNFSDTYYGGGIAHSVDNSTISGSSVRNTTVQGTGGVAYITKNNVTIQTTAVDDVRLSSPKYDTHFGGIVDIASASLLVSECYAFVSATNRSQDSISVGMIGGYDTKANIENSYLYIDGEGSDFLNTSNYSSFICINKFTYGAGNSKCYCLAKSGITPSSGVTALTEAQMKLQSCFKDLDFVNTWFIDLNTGINHPQLRNNPELPKVTYDVLYNYNGGANGPEAQIKYYNQDLKLSAQKPEKTCKITFDPTGGTVSQTKKTVNYTFANWRNEDGTTYAPGATYSKNESANLTAVWNNPTAGTLPTPSRSGYVFDGWYTAANGGYWVTASSELSGDTTLYAHWNEIAVSSLTINRHPTKTTYEIGETLNTSGLKLKANYTDGTTKIITSGYMLDTSGAFTTAGTKTVNVSYGGKTVSFTVTVNPAKLTSISVASKPSKTVYYVGDALNTSGLTLTAAYSDGSSKTISSGYTTSGFSSATAGTKTVTVTYQGKTATFTVTVKEKTVGVNDPQIIVESKSARKGEEVILNLKVKNNPGFNSASIRIDYDKNVMTLENAELGELYASCTPSYDNLPYITFYGPRNITSDGLLLKLIFKIKDNAESGDYAVGVTYSEGDIANVAEEDVNFAIVSGKISVTKYTPGDINGDGAVNVKDLTRLMRYINHEDVEVVTAALDVNGDGSVNVKDLTRLMRYINHEDVEIH